MADVKRLEGSGFCSSMTHEEFGTMQSTWRGEIQREFVKLKEMEHVSLLAYLSKQKKALQFEVDAPMPTKG